MNTVFDFLNRDILYARCLRASIVHAIMVGEYDLFAAEQSWDGLNYNFQNMEGIRGTISFTEDSYICAIQNNDMYEVNVEQSVEQNILEILRGADKKIVDLANNEALLYLLTNYKGEDVPFVSSAFWGNKNTNYSNMTETQIIRISENTIMPFLYNENDAKMYWKDDYEMTDEQMELAEDIYNMRVNISGKMNLTANQVNKLKEWFGSIDECIESFGELDIYLDNPD